MSLIETNIFNVGYKRVAVKMLKSNHRKEEVHDLLAEFNLLKEVNHPNVIVVFGACTSKGGPVCIIMEFAQHGSLRDYLRQSRGIVRPQPGISEYVKEIEVLSPKDIISFAWQVAKGMSYLSNMKLVHRDLAARNVLLSENMVCKVSDFGLTRDVYIDDAYWKKSNGRSIYTTFRDCGKLRPLKALISSFSSFSSGEMVGSRKP
jgi:proto-oncogene tyrosine-protein kinase Ret